jgi:hypothetical protein
LPASSAPTPLRLRYRSQNGDVALSLTTAYHAISIASRQRRVLTASQVVDATFEMLGTIRLFRFAILAGGSIAQCTA